MEIGWIGRDGKFYPSKHGEHGETAQTMPRSAFPAIRCCQNGYAFANVPLNQKQIDALYDWCFRNGIDWKEIQDFLEGYL